MDINDFRSLTTVLGLLCFLGIAGWAYSRSSKKSFDEAANLPFADDDDSVREAAQQRLDALNESLG